MIPLETPNRRNDCGPLRFAAAFAFLAAAIPASAVVAYHNPAGGSPGFNGAPSGVFSLGLDFDVLQDIQIDALGAFDFDQDGIYVADVVVRIYDRQTGLGVGSTVGFSTDSPGTLIEGSRFKSLLTPLLLPAGFQGSVVAYGFGSVGFGREVFVDESTLSSSPQTTDSGGGLLAFVSSRFEVGGSGIALPGIPDFSYVHSELLVNQYMAGTFSFAAEVPEASTWVGLASLGACGIIGEARRRLRHAA